MNSLPSSPRRPRPSRSATPSLRTPTRDRRSLRSSSTYIRPILFSSTKINAHGLSSVSCPTSSLARNRVLRSTLVVAGSETRVTSSRYVFPLILPFGSHPPVSSVQPTIFTDTKPGMKIVQEEIFGPVGVLVKFEDEEDVIRQANDTLYGLAAAVFTQDINRALETVHKLKAGTPWVNCCVTLNTNVPFGGFKQSGSIYSPFSWCLPRDSILTTSNLQSVVSWESKPWTTTLTLRRCTLTSVTRCKFMKVNVCVRARVERQVQTFPLGSCCLPRCVCVSSE
jgi:hypothetical protein